MRAAAVALTLLITALPGKAPLHAQAQPEGEGSPAQATAPEAEEEIVPSFLESPLLPEDGLLEPETWTAIGKNLIESVVGYLPQLLAGLLLFVLFVVLSRITRHGLTSLLQRSSKDAAVASVLGRLAGVAVLVLGGLMAASQAGLAVGSLLASVGVVGLAVGLAAQDSLSNLIAGLTILWDRPFRVGDRVTIADEYGIVTAVGLRTTTIETVRQLEAILPNSEVVWSKIVNHTRTPELRVDVPFGIAYHEDIDLARERLLEAVEGRSDVRTDQAPRVVVTELADSAIAMELRVWLVHPDRESSVYFALLELVKKTLDHASIEIPFPQRTLHLAREASQQLEEAASAKAPS